MQNQKTVDSNLSPWAAGFEACCLRPAVYGLLLCALLTQGCGREPVAHRQATVMGSSCEIFFTGFQDGDAEKILDGAFALLRDVDEKMSVFKPSSEIMTINREAGGALRTVSPETFEVLEKGAAYFERTGGVFDISIYPLVEAWGFYGDEPKEPSGIRIEQALSRTGLRHLILDKEARKAGLKIPGAGLDLGGIAKGYACDRVVRFLRSRGVENALVNIGGTIYGMGRSARGKPWRVGIRHPRDHERILKVITLRDQAVATSGDYEQFFVAGGRRYSHILDPRTGYPAENSVAVSVIAPSAMLADVLSTSLFILGPEKAAQIAGQFSQVEWHLAYFSDRGHLEVISSSPAVSS